MQNAMRDVEIWKWKSLTAIFFFSFFFHHFHSKSWPRQFGIGPRLGSCQTFPWRVPLFLSSRPVSSRQELSLSSNWSLWLLSKIIWEPKKYYILLLSQLTLLWEANVNKKLNSLHTTVARLALQGYGMVVVFCMLRLSPICFLSSSFPFCCAC